MPKKRVHEVAKEMGIQNARILEKLKDLGIEVKSHMSTLEENEVIKLQSSFAKKSESKAEPKIETKVEQKIETKTEQIVEPKIEPKTEPKHQEVAPQQKPAEATSEEKPQQRTPYAGQKPQGTGQGYQGSRPQGTGQGYQGSRPQGTGTGYQGSRPQGTGTGQGYQGSRPQGTGTGQGHQGSRPQGTGTGQGYQGSRPQGTGTGQGYQGSRPQGTGTGYQGSRPQGTGTGQGYQGSRPQGSGTGQGYQGQGGQSSGSRPPYQSSGQRPQGSGGQRPAGAGGQRPAPSSQKNQLLQQQKPQQRQYQSQNTQYQKPQPRPSLQKPKPAPRPKQAPKPLPEPIIEAQTVFEEDGIKTLNLGKNIVVKDFAEMMGEPGSDIIKILMKRGLMVNLNQEIDFYTASQIAESYGCIVQKVDEIDVLELEFAEDDANDEEATNRPPVVVVMGHVDHGKTSLLDRIRKSSVTANEAGGITQHIGAYTVLVGGKTITFLDTPGHEAFTAMRMRGARVTDIAILVVAADDGVMPQTIEAINHAKAANVEIIVAINKMDKASANPDRVKQELTEHGILVEEWGGEVISVPVSAIKGEGIEQLLEMVLLVAEMKELKANATKRARGTVIEALLDKGRGPVATILVQNGTLHVGDPIVAGATFGKIRAMMDDKGRKLKSAGPSTPVEILGLSEVPLAGDLFYTANNDKHARQVAESVIAQGRVEMIKAAPKVSLNDLFNQIQLGNVKDLNIVIKADVQGSVEAVKNSLERLSNDEVRIRTLHGGVGAITESDVMLASASNAIIIGFNVRPENNAKAVAEAENVDIRLYRIIYNAIEDIQAAMKGMLEPVYKEKVIGHAEIRQIFKSSQAGTIGGSYVTDGKFTRNAKVRVIRDGKNVYEGTLDTLKRFKDDVKEVASGYECGLLFHKFNDIKEGDKVEAFIMEEVPR